MRSLLAVCVVVAVVLGGVASAAAGLSPGPIRLRDKQRFVNEVVIVQGITGKKLDTISRSTHLYTVVDDFGDSIRVRTSQDWPAIGVTYRITGTIIYDGQLREYVLVEAERVQLGGAARLGPATPRPEGRVSAGAQTAPPRKAGAAESSDTLLLIGVGLLIVAGIVLLVIISSARRRRRAELRRRQREEAERARGLLAASPGAVTTATAPVPPAAPAALPRGATVAMTVAPVAPEQDARPRGTTMEAWGKLVVLEGYNKGTVFPLVGSKTVIGREAPADIALTGDEAVSRKHATVVRTLDGRVLFVDESRNGSRVNAAAVHMGQVAVVSGARIQVGMTTLEMTDFRQAVPNQAPADVPLSRRPTLHVGTGAARPGLPRASVVVVQGPDAGRRFPIAKHTVTIGRLDDRDIQLSDAQVSRKHATLSYDGEAFIIQNESATGTLVNGERVERARLSETDTIAMGETMLRIESEDGAGR